MEVNVVKMRPEDNVAIALHELQPGEVALGKVTANTKIPQAHKVALVDIPEGQPVKRYGVVLGYAKDDIKAGDWVNENSLVLPPSPDLKELKKEYGKNVKDLAELPKPQRTTWLGYDVPGCRYAGTRNILGIMTTVQCVAGICQRAVDRLKQEVLPKYPNVDDIVLIRHGYGCGVAINAKEARVPIRELRNIMKNPNFGGQVMMVGLG